MGIVQTSISANSGSWWRRDLLSMEIDRGNHQSWFSEAVSRKFESVYRGDPIKVVGQIL